MENGYARIRYDVHTLVISLQELAAKGRKPDLANFSGYDEYVRKVDAEVKGFIRQLS
jgi:hypothetical protein